MAFRADEAAQAGVEEVLAFLVPRPKELQEPERARSKEAVLDILSKYGPAVRGYPSWHPLVCSHADRNPVTVPGELCGYKGLDHTRFFANGFITCPYGSGQAVLESVAALPSHPVATVSAEKLEVKLYSTEATPILVKCTWEKPLRQDGTIPLSIAMPLILEKEVPCWRSAQVAETWDTMRPYFLGRPHGSRSSLFVNQETGQAIKKVWEALIHTGMFGPIMLDR